MQEKALAFKPAYDQGKPWLRASFSHLQSEVAEALVPPWPDLILAIGRRPAMVALEIKRRSQGRSKIVLLGRPRHRHHFDLVITPAHFLAPESENVCRVPWPLMVPDEASIEAAGRAWASRLNHLKRPLTAVLVGGATVPYALGARAGDQLVEQVRLATRGEGTLYFCTSRRSGQALRDALQSKVSQRSHSERLFEWMPDAKDNPYHALLALADRFVVTGDSLSMMLEVAQRSKPLALYIPPLGFRPRSLLARLSRSVLYGWHDRTQRFEPRAMTNALFYVGVIHYARDLGAIHRQLLTSGRAELLASGFASRLGALNLELDKAAGRVSELLDV